MIFAGIALKLETKLHGPSFFFTIQFMQRYVLAFASFSYAVTTVNRELKQQRC